MGFVVLSYVQTSIFQHSTQREVFRDSLFPIYHHKNAIFAEKSKIRPFPEIVNLQFLPTSFLSFKSLFQGI